MGGREAVGLDESGRGQERWDGVERGGMGRWAQREARVLSCQICDCEESNLLRGYFEWSVEAFSAMS